MLKINRESAMEQPEFAMADSFLRSCVTKVAESQEISAGTETKEDQLVRHFRLVASVSRLYLHILAVLNQDLLETLKGKKGNILSINKFLALRQLTETQLKGVTQGTWDVESKGVSTDTFQQETANSQISVSSEEIIEFIHNMPVITKDV